MNSKQLEALELMKSNENVFITGPGGVGKTYLINEYLKTADIDTTAVTAYTGIAATYIGGNTLNSWAGVGIDVTADVIKKIEKNIWIKRRWMNTKILIIDEISMISKDQFDILSEIGKTIRGIDKPFGGIKLILFGDFCQLPPISNDIIHFCFKSLDFPKKIIYLDEIMRQKDQVFSSILSKIRLGGQDLTDNDKSILNSRIFKDVLPPAPIAGLEPTIIDPYRQNVNEINMAKLKEIIKINAAEDSSRQTILFTAECVPQKKLESNQEFLIDMAYERVPCNKLLYLAVGAQVMLLKNLSVENGLVNGSRGVVRKIIYKDKMAIGVEVQFINGIIPIYSATWDVKINELKISIKQIPLILSYALTSHKCMGASMDYVKINLADCFEYGQFYVMLSRVRTLEGLIITDIDYSKIKIHPDVLEFYN